MLTKKELTLNMEFNSKKLQTCLNLPRHQIFKYSTKYTYKKNLTKKKLPTHNEIETFSIS